MKASEGPKSAKSLVSPTGKLDYWARTGLLRPSVLDAAGSGSQRLYSYEDIVELKVTGEAAPGLRGQPPKGSSCHCLFAWSPVTNWPNQAWCLPMSVRCWRRAVAEIIDLLKGGQGVFNIVPLGNLLGEVDAAIVDSCRSTGRAQVKALDGKWAESSARRAEGL